MQYEQENNPGRTVGLIIGISITIAGGISLFIAGEQLMSSARSLDITAFGNELTRFFLIGIALLIIGIFVDLIFFPRRRYRE